MNIQAVLRYLTSSEMPLPVECAVLVLVAGLFVLVFIKLLKRVNAGTINTRISWILQLIFLPLMVISLESTIIFFTDLKSADTGYACIRSGSQTLLWIVFSWLMVRAVDIFVWKGIVRKRTGTEVPNLLIHFVSFIIYLLAVYFILTFVFNREVTGLVVSSGIIAGVLGLSMQSTLGDLIAGIALTIERPYRIDDWIELKDGTLGKVIDINWRSTRLRSWNNSMYVIPNGQAMSATLHNFSLPDRTYGYWFFVYLQPEVSPVLARRVLLEAALSCDSVLKEPTPVVRLSDAGERPYKYMVFVHFRDYPTFFASRDDLMMRIWSHCSKAGIMPPPITHNVSMFTGEQVEIKEPGLAELLEDVDIFHPLTEDEIQELINRMDIRSYRSGETIVLEGQTGDSLFVVAAGVVAVSHTGPEGRRVELARFGMGQYFGELSLLTGEPRSADVNALTDCQVIEFSMESLQPILKGRPEIMEELAQIMAKRRLSRETMLRVPHRMSTSELLGSYANELLSGIKSFFSL